MNDLETRQLRYFVAVAEELNFGRAAERLNMAQPPLSRAIRELERQLGVVLLERTTRRVELTASGEALLRDARTALDAVSAAGRRAQHAGEARPRLRVALKADVDGGLLPRILEEYAAQETGQPVSPVLVRYGEQAAAIRDGRADVGLLLLSGGDARGLGSDEQGPDLAARGLGSDERGLDLEACELDSEARGLDLAARGQDPEARSLDFEARGLDFEVLAAEPFLVAVAVGDPLASRSEVCLADLADRTMPNGKPADQGPVSADECSFIAGDRVSGPSDLPEIFRLIELGSIVCYFPASLTARYPRPDIVYLPVTDIAPATLAVAWPQDSRSPAVAAFVRAATATATAATPPATRPPQPPPPHPNRAAAPGPFAATG